MRVVLLDNRDSFVYNLVDLFAYQGAKIEVYRNNVALETVLQALKPTAEEQAAGQRPLLCLSPGPGHPREAGCLMDLVERALADGIPTLGICLGFQAMVESCGGVIDRVGPVHGQASAVNLTTEGRQNESFGDLDDTFEVARYHSLGTTELPAQLVSLAATEEGIVMAAKHHQQPMIGLQFHPESILTPAGPQLIKNLLKELSQTETQHAKDAK
ncbi:anthranilate synthase component II [Boudabousia liubingyangii]|uniref:anthranilate synthase component II n=1 Tax=Boudabousia liubingyangii TaxID=1921764 RepID=UPI00093F12C7|nr:aminodeoxychorismate/anthranilate synthase component II [Boudabousia liubingyangii]OKL46828.1 anthranilate synthase component II [Boudabousia liubingyangii]